MEETQLALSAFDREKSRVPQRAAARVGRTRERLADVRRRWRRRYRRHATMDRHEHRPSESNDRARADVRPLVWFAHAAREREDCVLDPPGARGFLPSHGRAHTCRRSPAVVSLDAMA